MFLFVCSQTTLPHQCQFNQNSFKERPLEPKTQYKLQAGDGLQRSSSGLVVSSVCQGPKVFLLRHYSKTPIVGSINFSSVYSKHRRYHPPPPCSHLPCFHYLLTFQVVFLCLCMGYCLHPITAFVLDLLASSPGAVTSSICESLSCFFSFLPPRAQKCFAGLRKKGTKCHGTLHLAFNKAASVMPWATGQNFPPNTLIQPLASVKKVLWSCLGNIVSARLAHSDT